MTKKCIDLVLLQLFEAIVDHFVEFDNIQSFVVVGVGGCEDLLCRKFARLDCHSQFMQNVVGVNVSESYDNFIVCHLVALIRVNHHEKLKHFLVTQNTR